MCDAVSTHPVASLRVHGLRLDEARGVLTEQAGREYIRELLAAIRADVLGGHSDAHALTPHPRDLA
ncbi:hypothetical protein CF645_38150 [Burkholderia pseudomallei]|uniref:hypothetical protein n=1 Tax=Burkholderia pseudomallei TaxID=28450 RepID=UPI000CCEF41C|nr:hypothetical protein CF645_38150 [Burkholderia pseudomallei]